MFGIVTSRTTARMFRPPSPPYSLNLGSQQSQGLIAWWPLGRPDATLGYMDYSKSKVSLTNNGAILAKPMGGFDGFGASNDGTNTNWLDAANGIVAALPATLTTWVVANNVTQTFSLLNVMNSGSSYLSLAADGNNEYGFNDQIVADPSGAGTSAGSGGAYQAGVPFLAQAVFNTTTDRTAGLNGSFFGSSAVSRAFSAPTRTSLCGFRFSGATSVGMLNGWMFDSRIYNYALTQAQLFAQYDPVSRWELYYPLNRVSYFFDTPVSGLPKPICHLSPLW